MPQHEKRTFELQITAANHATTIAVTPRINLMPIYTESGVIRLVFTELTAVRSRPNGSRNLTPRRKRGKI